MHIVCTEYQINVFVFVIFIVHAMTMPFHGTADKIILHRIIVIVSASVYLEINMIAVSYIQINCIVGAIKRIIHSMKKFLSTAIFIKPKQ